MRHVQICLFIVLLSTYSIVDDEALSIIHYSIAVNDYVTPCKLFHKTTKVKLHTIMWNTLIAIGDARRRDRKVRSSQRNIVEWVHYTVLLLCKIIRIVAVGFLDCDVLWLVAEKNEMKRRFFWWCRFSESMREQRNCEKSRFLLDNISAVLRTLSEASMAWAICRRRIYVSLIQDEPWNLSVPLKTRRLFF